MTYIAMMATDWFFVHEYPGGDAKRTHVVHHLAAWALKEDGKITGLVGKRRQREKRTDGQARNTAANRGTLCPSRPIDCFDV